MPFVRVDPKQEQQELEELLRDPVAKKAYEDLNASMPLGKN